MIVFDTSLELKRPGRNVSAGLAGISNFAAGATFFKQVENKAVENQTINRVLVKIFFPNSPFRIYFLTYLTPGISLKCSSCVRKLAWKSRAVARMMLSAIGNFVSAEILAALKAIGAVRSRTWPLYRSAIRISAAPVPSPGRFS